MVCSPAKRMLFALGRGFVRLGRCWATQFGLAYALTWAPDAAHLAREQQREEETEHWDWSIPYHWYEISR
ncbi:hypothetical protein GCM10010116_56680 [Microbispora rosea subsp. aerata]|nr:hypothetical protein GCM10010116_56680 [Microbispora rosea subsp. aerata]GIH58736.1 hypothetical protein Mro02_56500 [Microbispora rosea subsp. aerata]GLJ82449.1 hypothetical protein GCM10017588_11740 [Microbispora rosea subsp. aerata]